MSITFISGALDQTSSRNKEGGTTSQAPVNVQKIASEQGLIVEDVPITSIMSAL
uniref:Putative DHS-like NAD/FAD-binding domain-containing protein n=1 Tax=Moniliophthora roreri TaxID=221103 RepID=A0A0W0EYN1_MONRR